MLICGSGLGIKLRSSNKVVYRYTKNSGLLNQSLYTGCATAQFIHHKSPWANMKLLCQLGLTHSGTSTK